MKIRIRDMEEADLDSVLAIEKASFPTPWAREMFSEDLNRPFSRPFAAESAEGDVLGYAVCWNVAGESHLLNIAVHPDFRGCGIGAALLKEVIRRGGRVGSKWVHLEVRTGNEQAQALYRKHGFAFMGMRKGYYTDTGEDAMLFSRRIRPADAT
ncbi:MAG: ribosomal protein S18-alanine N-acetyltransferase [Syntrophorhabdaceae bacterium]|nr:ribosomal protein S18-alanine N-acetyltransferase [Syntrophorhabdaceae bacterium]